MTEHLDIVPTPEKTPRLLMDEPAQLSPPLDAPQIMDAEVPLTENKMSTDDVPQPVMNEGTFCFILKITKCISITVKRNIFALT